MRRKCRNASMGLTERGGKSRSGPGNDPWAHPFGGIQGGVKRSRSGIPSDLAPQLRAIIPDAIKMEHKQESEVKRAPRDRVAEGRYKTRRSESAAQLKPWIAMGIGRATYYKRKAAGSLPAIAG